MSKCQIKGCDKQASTSRTRSRDSGAARFEATIALCEPHAADFDIGISPGELEFGRDDPPS